jgi:hypothetical protein
MSTADDRWEILRLLHVYAHAADSADLDTFAGLFAKGSLTIPGYPTAHGSDEVRKQTLAVLQLYDGSPRTNHLVHNPVIEIDPDGRTARVKSYVQVLQEVLPDFPLQTIGTGRYLDVMCKDEGGWYFKERVAEAVFRGDLSWHAKSAAET